MSRSTKTGKSIAERATQLRYRHGAAKPLTGPVVFDRPDPVRAALLGASSRSAKPSSLANCNDPPIDNKSRLRDHATDNPAGVCGERSRTTCGERSRTIVILLALTKEGRPEPLNLTVRRISLPLLLDTVSRVERDPTHRKQRIGVHSNRHSRRGTVSDSQFSNFKFPISNLGLLLDTVSRVERDLTHRKQRIGVPSNRHCRRTSFGSELLPAGPSGTPSSALMCPPRQIYPSRLPSNVRRNSLKTKLGRRRYPSTMRGLISSFFALWRREKFSNGD
jgi:hypothetical protein